MRRRMWLSLSNVVEGNGVWNKSALAIKMLRGVVAPPFNPGHGSAKSGYYLRYLPLSTDPGSTPVDIYRNASIY